VNVFYCRVTNINQIKIISNLTPVTFFHEKSNSITKMVLKKITCQKNLQSGSGNLMHPIGLLSSRQLLDSYFDISK